VALVRGSACAVAFGGAEFARIPRGGIVEVDGMLQFYGFTDHVEPGKTVRQMVQDIARQPGVRFVAQFTGSFLVFAAAEHASLGDAQTAIGDAYVNAGLRSEWSQLVVPSRVEAPKRGSPDFCALVRARARDDPETVLGRIDDAFEERHNADPSHTSFSYGAGVVTGRDYDLLIDLGTDTLHELFRTVKDDLRSVSGLGRTSTATADLRDNAVRPGKPESS
jgi:hypothetical protein